MLNIMNKSKNEYITSKKSRELIKKTLIQMIKEQKAQKEINVSTLVDKAHINRGTFYFHYKSIDEVYREIEDEIIFDLKQLLVTSINTNKEEVRDATLLVNYISQFIKSNEKLYSYFLTSYEYHYFLSRLKQELVLFIFNDFLQSKEDRLIVVIDFYINGMIGLYQDYYEGKLNLSFSSLNESLILILNNIFN